MANREIYKIKIDGEQLKKQIREKGYTVKSISKEIGVDPWTVYKYLRMNMMPPYIHEKIYTIVENIRTRYTYYLKESSKIESRWLKSIPTQYEIIRYRELTILTYQLEQMMN